MSSCEEVKKEDKEKVFKVKKTVTTTLPVNQKKRLWKSLKQIIIAERALPWSETAVHYSFINSPPSFKPTKKYSDISGFVAPYTDPLSKLYFATIEEYQTIQNLPSDIVAGYLLLRRAQNPI